MKDTYKTISEQFRGEYKEKGSKFIACTYPFESESELKSILAISKKTHFKAGHHCYAYRIGTEGKQFRANDDGEPSGTAGRPILGQIDRYELTNILIIVVRYYGGTKLGTSGLIRAYKEATKAALGQAIIVEKIRQLMFEIEFDYTDTNLVMQLINNSACRIVDSTYELTTKMTLAVRCSAVEQFKKSIEELNAAILLHAI